MTKKTNQNCQGRDAVVRHLGRRRAQGPLFACVEAAKLSVPAFCMQESVEKGNPGEAAARLIGRHGCVSVAQVWSSTPPLKSLKTFRCFCAGVFYKLDAGNLNHFGYKSQN